MTPNHGPDDRYKPNWIWLAALMVLGTVAFLGITGVLSVEFVVVLHVIVVGAGLTTWAYGRRG